jgi:hypothetical protein
MNLHNVFVAMEKIGALKFSSKAERDGLLKIAMGVQMPQQGAMPPMDPAMLQNAQVAAQQGGMPPMVDPSTIQMPQEPAPSVGGAGQASTSATMVGESITNSDLESLVKVVNIISSLKNEYDEVKKEQMDVIKQQTSELAGTSPATSAVNA